jgi:hypothetical protein
MASFACIGCGVQYHGPCRPSTWHTLTVEVDDAATSRTTAKIRCLDFCEECEPVAQRLAAAMCASERETPDKVETFDERPPLAAAR